MPALAGMLNIQDDPPPGGPRVYPRRRGSQWIQGSKGIVSFLLSLCNTGKGEHDSKVPLCQGIADRSAKGRNTTETIEEDVSGSTPSFTFLPRPQTYI